MANPQKEDGHVALAVEIVEALMKVNLSPYETRVLWCVLRKTYGWQKKMDRISLSQFAVSTGLDRRLIPRTLNSLAAKNMLVIFKDDRKLVSYGLQKDYELWVTSPGMSVTSAEMSVKRQNAESTGDQPKGDISRDVRGGDISRDVRVTSAEMSTKETITKEKRHSPPKKKSPHEKPPEKPPVALTGEQADRFSRFYAAYPKKRAKQDAIKAWRKISPENGLFETIMAAVAKQKRSDDWTRENGRFIPNPASWLNGRRWEDEVDISPLRRKGTW